jgi:TRAP-type C4-dicarboxylate transport system permease small subunit
VEADNPRLNKVIRLTAAVEDGLLVIALIVLIALAGNQILMRNLWQSGLSWGDPLIRVLVLWVGLLGAMAATRDDNHIRIDILSRWLPARARILTRLVTDLFTALVCALLAYHSARFVLLDRDAGIIAFARIPAWLCELILPLGFGVIALRFALLFALRLRRLRTRGASPKAPSVEG